MLAAASAGAQTSLPSLGDRDRFFAAARAAWAFIERHIQPQTGWVPAHATYPFITTWDIASVLAAYVAAHDLGLLSTSEYERRVRQALRTLQRARLFRNAAYNKLYDARTGDAVDRTTRPDLEGYGWSAIDLGRLLLWLRIVAHRTPSLAADAEAVVRRLDAAQLVGDGYLQGADLDPRSGTLRRYPEGRIGYEQYAAAGFALWGIRAPASLDFRRHAKPILVEGIPLWGDARGDDRLTAEPFYLMGLELGWWTPEWRDLAWRVLAAQEARYRRTGRLTFVSEDALPVPPHYFYYYNLYENGQTFVVTHHGTGPLSEPRWVSTKAVFAWHALLPSPYTARAIQVLEAARQADGWGAGLFEDTLQPTGGANLNTAAVVLEAAAYAFRGRPLYDGPLPTDR